MQKINVCIIGGGNISNTRYIPALKKKKNVNILGVTSNLSPKEYR
jgi:predicted dehydrogenase